MNAIVTRADNNIKEMTDITHPILKRYAAKCNSDFKIISENKGLHPHYRIMQCKELLDEYDRIIVLDSDMLILNSCPDLFELVPDDSIGVVYEDKGSRQEDRLSRIKKIQDLRGNIGWDSDYINTGCFVVSKIHQSIFVTKNLYNDLGYDDVELGYQIHKRRFNIFELPYTFNFMSMWTESWCGAKKSDAFIIHYAGNGFVLLEDRVAQIKNDYNILKRYNLI